MKQLSNRNKTIRKKVTAKKQRNHPLFGTSKLEKRFAVDFLEKLGVRYIYQFEVKEIGRFYDFYLPDHNILIEIDGGYW